MAAELGTADAAAGKPALACTHGSFHRCVLCRTRHCSKAALRSHKLTDAHQRHYDAYLKAYFAERKRLEREEALLRLVDDPKNEERLGRMEWVDRQRNAPYWCGDLRFFKAALFDHLMSGGEVEPLRCGWIEHVRRVQSELLLLAFVKVALASEFGSIELARECVPPSTTTDRARQNWRDLLRKTSAAGYLVQSLIMPHVDKCVMFFDLISSK